MNTIHANLKTDCMALASVQSVSEQHVSITIEASDKWNAEGLLKLSALLKGVAMTLIASVLLLGLMTVADAIEWVPFSFEAAEAYDNYGH